MRSSVYPRRLAFFAAAEVLCCLTTPALAQAGSPADMHANEIAAQYNPFDPVPPPGGFHPAPGGHHSPPPRDTLTVDCSGTHHEMFHSLAEAVRRAPYNATILILPPGKGSTCRERETIKIDKPLTIASYGGGHDAVIEAPLGETCLSADIPLGDTLTIDGVRFITHSNGGTCLEIKKGNVAVRNSAIDSRSSAWAFDIADSVEIAITDTRIVTDGSGIRACRAKVTLENVDIEIEGEALGSGPSPMYCSDKVANSVGLLLDHATGTVEGGSITGGITGIEASSGARNLRLAGVKIYKAETGLKIAAGGSGVVTANRLVVTGGKTGIEVAMDADAEVTDNIIAGADHTGIKIGGDPSRNVRVTGNTIYARRHADCIAGASQHGNICHTQGWWPF